MPEIEETDSKKGKCEYHQCTKKHVELYECEICHGHFCKEHIESRPVGMPRFKGTNVEDRLFMQEWHKPGGHPCVGYLEKIEEERKRKDEAYAKFLDGMKKKEDAERKIRNEARANFLDGLKRNGTEYRSEKNQRWKNWINSVTSRKSDYADNSEEDTESESKYEERDDDINGTILFWTIIAIIFFLIVIAKAIFKK